MRWNKMLVVLGVGSFAMGACGDPVDDDPTGGSTSQTEPSSATDPTTEGEAESDTSPQPVACNGGPACGAGEFCTTGNEDCDCDAQFQYCDLIKTDPGCYAIPDACAALTGDAQLECIGAQACSFLDIDSGWMDGVLHCGHYDECAGDCDFDPDSCVETSSGPGDSGSSDSGSDSGSADSGSTDSSSGG